MRFILFVFIAVGAYLSYSLNGNQWTEIGLMLLFSSGISLGRFVERQEQLDKAKMREVLPHEKWGRWNI